MNIVEPEVATLSVREALDVKVATLAHAHVPDDMDELTAPELVLVTKSLANLNRSLVTSFNTMARAFEQLGAALEVVVDSWAEFADRLEAEEEAAAEQASETSAAADWPGSVRPESLGGAYPESLTGQATGATAGADWSGSSRVI